MRRYVLYVVALVLGFVLVLVLFSPRNPRSPRRSFQPPVEEIGEQQTTDLPTTLRISFRCGHELILAREEVEELMGQLGVDADSIHWNDGLLMSAATGTVRYGRVASDCTDCRELFLVTVQEGFVVVYGGRYADGRPHMVTDIPMARLPLDLQVQLEQGVMLQNEAELVRFLEGIDR